jgi:DNA recombination protein RmuC
METILVVVLIVIVALLAFVLMKLSSRKREGASDSSMLIQQQMDMLRTEMSQNLKNTSDSLATALKSTTDTVFQTLNITKDTVSQQLGVVTSHLSNVTQQLQNNTGQMGSRLDNAAKVIQDVQNKLGELGKATQEIKELGQSVSKLEEMLKAPKLRGGLGELLLEDMLKQVLPAGSYDVQYAFKNGQRVDAIIHTAGGKVPVDSKFPLENFRKLLDAKSEQDKKTTYRTFVADVKKHIDAIAEKYILPDEGTFDFALMYIPAENIYYETIIKDESYGDDNGLHAYAIAKHVVPVSPNSFFAHLMVIALGFKGLQIERGAKEIRNNLSRLSVELQKFGDVFGTLGSQINNAKNNYDKADKQLASLGDRLKSVAELPEESSGNQLRAL